MTYDDYVQQITELAKARNIDTTGENWPTPTEWITDYTNGFTPQEAVDILQEAAELDEG